jgi:peroxiredoxin (alkyl hydroperoxide reductase subunit C)
MFRSITRAARLLAPSAARSFHASAGCFHGAVVRRLAPDFNADAVLPDGSFGKVSLNDFKGKYVLLFWYPLDFTFVCPTEITAFSDRVKEFRDIGCEVVGISIDSKFSHLAWVNTPRNKGGLGKMDIPLIGDISKVMSHEYGMLVEDADDDMDGIALRGVRSWNEGCY